MKALAPTLLLIMALPSALDAEPRHPAVITRPDWVTMPSAEDLESFYPPTAWALQLEGRAAIACGVEASGVLSGCSVVAESPPELGFGPAALRMASVFKMRPMTKDGAPVGGGHVTIPIAFRLPPRPSPPALQPVDPETLDLARRLLAASPQFAEYMPADVALPEDTVTPPQTRAAATEALNTVIGAHRKDFLEFMARSVASILSRDELQALVNYVILGQSPQLPPGEAAGQFDAKLHTAFAAARQTAMQLANQYAIESQAIFCKTRVCAPGGKEAAGSGAQAQARR